LATLAQRSLKAAILRGEEAHFSVTVGGVAVSAGDPIIFTTGAAVAATDGSEIQGVMKDDGSAAETNVRCSILRDGDVWLFTVASLTSTPGTRFAAAGGGALDEGTGDDPSIGWLIEETLTADSVQATVLICRGAIA